MDINTYVKIALMLSVTLVALFIFVYALKKIKRIMPSVSGNLQVLSGAHIGNKSKLMVVEFQGKQLLLGVTDHHIRTLFVHQEKNIEVNAAHE